MEKVRDIREILRSDWMVGDAEKSNNGELEVNRECFYLRGLVPKSWTFREQTEDYHIEEIPEGYLHDLDRYKAVFLDGTGGKFAKDPRIRVVGWAWVQPDIAHIHGEAVNLGELGQRGTIPGKQTVPRAEAFALMQFMRFYAGVCFE